MSANGPGAPALTPLQRAFLALEQSRARVLALESAAREPIAIVGVGCRLPGGVDSPDSFWRLLADGVDAIGPVPLDRWDGEALFDPNPDVPGRIAAKAGGYLGSIDGFDPAVFGIAPREAASMDPQQRLLLEVAWEALEHAGTAPDRLEKTATGVFVGVTSSDYSYLQLGAGDPSLLDAHFTSGIAHSMHSGRLSYLLGLQGPSLTIDTACSSSLVAVHLACNAVRGGECRMAIAGGVNLMLSPDVTIALSRARMLAPDGRCKTFSASADGFSRGEGCALVVLKRLSDAQADGDRVLAVIRGSAVNQDGASSSLTAPNGPAQEAVVRDALARAGVAPRDVSYVEAHGTGTQLGDPIEVRALGAVYGEARDASRPLVIGSIKTNVGHLEAAAGIAGLVKVALALQARTIPKHLHFDVPSPHIPWDELSVVVPTHSTPWEPINGKRIAAVSAFGFSGTNAHVVLEEAPAIVTNARSVPANKPSAWLVPLSAADGAALRDNALRLAAALTDRSELADICLTVSIGRAHLSHRAVVSAHDVAELRDRLTTFAHTGDAPGVRTSRLARRDPARAVFLFTGQGAQRAGMARSLYDNVAVFRDALDRCASILAPHLAAPLTELMWGDASARLDDTQFTQPALVALEWSLAQLWRHWGVSPSAVLGHSVGEYVGACLAGVMSLEDMLVLVAGRGRLMQQLPSGGAMTVIAADEATVAAAVAPYSATVAIGGINAPDQTVVSGAASDVKAIADQFAARGVRVRPLQVSHAFHSPLLDPMLAEFERTASAIRFAAPSLRVVSNLTGRVAEPGALTTASYWRQHARQPVRFADGARALAALRPDLCIEIGPHPALLAAAEGAFAAVGTTSIPTLRNGRDDWEQVLESVGTAWLHGATIDWSAIYSPFGATRIALPTYAWQRGRHWFAVRPPSTANAPRGRDTRHPLLGTRLRAASNDTIFESTIAPDAPAWVAAHRVQDHIVMPGTAYLEALRAAGERAFGATSVTVSDVTVREALVLEGARTFQTIVEGSGATRAVRCCSLAIDAAADDDDAWSTHAGGSVRAGVDAITDATDLALVRDRCTTNVTSDDFYADLARRGLGFGAALRTLRTIRRGSGEAVAEVVLDDATAGDVHAYGIHPILLDGCLQAAAVAMPADSDTNDDALFLPLGIGTFALHARVGAKCWCHATASGSGATRRADVTVYDEAGTVVGVLRDVRLARATAGALARIGERWLDDALYELRYETDIGVGASATREPALDAALAPASLASVAAAVLPGLARDTSLERYDELQAKLESLSARYVEQAFARLGWQPTVDERITAEPLRERLGVLRRHRRLFVRLLDIAAEVGFLRRSGDEWIVLRALDAAGAEAARVQLAEEWAAFSDAPELEMTGRAGERLADALRGAADPHQLLFPDGSTDNAERMYRDAAPARVMNGLVATAISGLARAASPERPLRILEIGAGTGGTTAHLAPELPADRVTYTFSDVGPLFVARARERFAKFGFMSFDVLDLEREPQAQGFTSEAYDVVIATNVIHATADLRRTLARVRRLLAPGGTLVMLEVTEPQRWFDLTVGLTDGWWAFTDGDLRAEYATLPRTRWLELLEECGFVATASVPADARATGSLARQALILARTLETASRNWLVWSAAQGTMAALTDALRARGDSCVLVTTGDTYALDGNVARVRAESTDDVGRLLADCHAAARPIHGVVYGAALDSTAWEAETSASLADAQTRGAINALHVAQALVDAPTPTPRLWIVTRGAQQTDARNATLDPAQAPIVGLGLAISREHPELAATCVDLDPSLPSQDVASLLAELDRPRASAGADPRVARRGETRRVARLGRLRPTRPAPTAAAPAWRLVRDAGGALDGLTRDPVAPDAVRAPGDGEVEVRVAATGLNFKDVLNALGMYPGNPGPIGGECAGIVARVGGNVTHVKAGDRVIAVASGSFASHVIARATLVRPLPDTMSFEEGAAFPIAYLTAHFCLDHLAHIRAGDRVLIHAAAGGVGMAAVRIAQRAGAEVFATAGAEWKRDLVRALGVTHVFDSRSPAFADDLARLTDGRGVDVVLNSLAGETLDASFRVLARGGRFVEIGKRGIRTAQEVAAADPTARYFVVDWGETAAQQPELIGEMFATLAADLHAGRIRSLPRHVFGHDDVERAFRFMAQARHAGRIVVTHRAGIAAETPTVHRDGTYLVTGGLSGLGLVVARWLGERGAGRVVLVSRRGVTAAARPVIDALTASGVDVIAEALDVSDERALTALIERLRASGPPLRGVIHSAGTLDDAGIPAQTSQRFRTVLAPKVTGGYLLDRLTRPDPLDWFVLFSSIASVLGGRGQANHSTANAFLDVLARERRANGRPGLSINWGPWSDIGAAVDRGAATRLAAQGLAAVTPVQGLQALDRLLANPDVAQAVVLVADWRRYVSSQNGAPSALLSHLVASSTPTATIAKGTSRDEPTTPAVRAPGLREQLATTPPARRRAVVQAFVRERAHRALGVDPNRPIDPRTPLGELGLDSLLAVELRNTLGASLGVALPATLLFDHPTIDALTDHLLNEVLGESAPKRESPALAAAPAAPPASAPAGALVSSIEAMSDDEVERLLATRGKRR